MKLGNFPAQFFVLTKPVVEEIIFFVINLQDWNPETFSKTDSATIASFFRVAAHSWKSVT